MWVSKSNQKLPLVVNVIAFPNVKVHIQLLNCNITSQPLGFPSKNPLSTSPIFMMRCLSPMRWLNIHPRGFIFLPSGEGGGEWEGGILLIFVSSSCSQSVPNDVPQVFNIFHRLFPIAFYFVSYHFPKFSPSHLHRWAKGKALNPHTETVILGSLPSFSFFLVIAKKKYELWRSTHLMNRRGEVNR